MIRAVGEPFSTSRSDKLWLVFDRELIDQLTGEIVVEGDEPVGLGRSSDVLLHELVKESKLTRDADGSTLFVKRLKPDGTGMTLVIFKD